MHTLVWILLNLTQQAIYCTAEFCKFTALTYSSVDSVSDLVASSEIWKCSGVSYMRRTGSIWPFFWERRNKPSGISESLYVLYFETPLNKTKHNSSVTGHLKTYRNTIFMFCVCAFKTSTLCLHHASRIVIRSHLTVAGLSFFKSICTISWWMLRFHQLLPSSKLFLLLQWIKSSCSPRVMLPTAWTENLKLY